MMSIQHLREQAAALSKDLNHMLADAGDVIWSAEKQAEFDEKATLLERARGQISAIEKAAQDSVDRNVSDIERFRVSAGDKSPERKAIEIYLRNDMARMSSEQMVTVRNAMSTTTAAEGGYTVPAEIAAMVIDKLKWFGGMRSVATILSTVGGNALNFPTSDGTAEVGEIVAENAAAAAGDITFGTIALPVFKYSSKKIALPWELIDDSAIDVVAFVVDRLAMRIARIQNTHFTTGAGTTVPDGIVPKAVLGKTGTTGQTLTVIYDDLVDLKFSVDKAYRQNGAKWMMNDASVAVISKIKETTGAPIWQPGITAGAPDVLLGHAVETNNDMAVMAANAKSILFGDLSQYTIRDVQGSTSLRRFDDSAFGLLGQVGFCGWQRSGGNLLQTAAVKYYINSAT